MIPLYQGVWNTTVPTANLGSVFAPPCNSSARLQPVPSTLVGGARWRCQMGPAGTHASARVRLFKPPDPCLTFACRQRRSDDPGGHDRHYQKPRRVSLRDVPVRMWQERGSFIVVLRHHKVREGSNPGVAGFLPEDGEGDRAAEEEGRAQEVSGRFLKGPNPDQGHRPLQRCADGRR